MEQVYSEEFPDAGESSATPPAAAEAAADHKAMLISEVKKKNLTLASALEKAKSWDWKNQSLSLVFESPYEATLVKNEAETIRQAAAAAGMPSFTVETRTEPGRQEEAGSNNSPRVDLIRQVFRGQIIKG